MTAQMFMTASIVSLVSTAALHSWGGERFLLRPMFNERGNRVLESGRARMVLRLAWHVTSLSWLILAFILFGTAFSVQDLPRIVLTGIGSGFVFAGLGDLVLTKGQHMGWPVLLATGVFALLALALI